MHYTEMYRGYVVSIALKAQNDFVVSADYPYPRAQTEEGSRRVLINGDASQHYPTLAEAFAGLATARRAIDLLVD